MKRIRRSMRIVSVLLICAFLFMGGWLGFTVFTQGSRWVTSANNPRLNTARKNVAMGNITDRNGTLLATTTVEGERRYASNKTMRRALSQTVGDQMSMSGTGVETFHMSALLGFSGSIIDRTWQYINGEEYRGDDIRLTVSAELTQYIYEQFPKKKEGAVVVLNYKTGEVLSMVSMPGYDPQVLANRRAEADTTGTAYLNRCLQGQYTPGSVFKIVTLAAALEYLPGVAQRTFTCSGPTMFGNSKVTCFGGIKHGKMDLMEAFAESCNVTFASLAWELGGATLVKKSEQMGFNNNFSFRDLVLYDSSVPQDLSAIEDVAWTGVGQGKLLVTPMHMAMITGAVANGGAMREPQLIKQITGVGGIPKLRTASGNVGRVMETKVAEAIAKYMKKAVDSGTASQARIKGYAVCGKTGTAETSDDKKVQTDAWYVGFIDDDSAPYAIAVVIEKGGTGSGAATPLAAKALKKAIALGLSQ